MYIPKVGDWVRHAMDFNTIYQVTKVFEDSIETNDPNNRNFMNESLIYLTDGTEFLRLIGTNFVFKPESIAYETLLKGKSSYPLAILQEGLVHWEEKVWFLHDCEVWEPQEGEWCWVYNVTREIPYLCKVIRLEDNYKNRVNDYKFTKAVIVSRGDTSGDEVGYRFCEPFLGELPSIIDNKGTANENSN